MRRHDGQWRQFLVRAIPLFDANQAIRQWVGVHTDITEQRQAELALQEAGARKDVFLATLSHELFTESQRRQKFPSTDGYACFLATKRTGVVLIHASYPAKFRKSELQRLDELAQRGQAELQYGEPSGTRAYVIHVPESFRRETISDCDI